MDNLFKYFLGERVKVNSRNGIAREGNIVALRHESFIDGRIQNWYLVDIQASTTQWRKESEIESTENFHDEFELGFNKLMLDIALTNKDYKECERLHKLIDEIESKGRIRDE